MNDASEPKKVCFRCREPLPLSCFPVDTRRKDGRQNRCRECNREIMAEWRRRQPGKAASQKARRMARLQAAPGDTPTRDELRTLVLVYDTNCAYCSVRQAETFDHITPLVRGGSKGIENLVPACRECNAAKGAMTFEEWRQHPSYQLIQGAAAERLEAMLTRAMEGE